MNINEFMKETFKVIDLGEFSFSELRPRIFCRDGTSLSVQGSHSHYSSPRRDGTMFFEVEVGFPSVRPPKEWGQYFDGEWMELSLVGRIKYIYKNFSMIAFYIKRKNFRGAYEYIVRDNATNSVYGYVPVDLVQEFINIHGGIDVEKTLEVG